MWGGFHSVRATGQRIAGTQTLIHTGPGCVTHSDNSLFPLFICLNVWEAASQSGKALFPFSSLLSPSLPSLLTPHYPLSVVCAVGGWGCLLLCKQRKTCGTFEDACLDLSINHMEFTMKTNLMQLCY